MEKETILAKIRITMGFSKETLVWLEEVQNTKESSVKLASLPGGVKFPNHLEYKIRYDATEKLLIFRGVVSEQERDELLNLSRNESYRGAIKELFQSSQIWFVRNKGNSFLGEFGGTWKRTLISSAEPIIHSYFLELGLSKKKLPRVKVYESYPGSWIMDAALVMFGSVGSVYIILKGLSELPRIADGLIELKDRLKKVFSNKASEKVNENLISAASQYELPPPPSKPIDTDLVLDARPLLSLRPSAMKSHKIHITVAVSRDAFTLENLGQDTMRNIGIGIFKSSSRKNQWNYGDSCMGLIDILSSQQTITKAIADFRNSSGDALDLSDSSPLHVDCWVQDTHGIYLFMFYLED